jgi:hypothetical protein
MSNRGVNNSNVLSGEKKHVIVVNKDDADKIREYTEALGTTSLHDSLSILSSLETSVSQKGKAIGDLILLRHILSGEIQFKEKRLFNLFQSVIGKKFETIGKRMTEKIIDYAMFKQEIEKVILKLDNNEKDISVIARPLVSLMVSFAVAAGASYIPFITIVEVNYSNILWDIKDKIENIEIEMRKIYMKGPPYDNTSLEQLADQAVVLQTQFRDFRDSDYVKENFTNLLLSNGNVFYPILLGLIASMKAAQSIIKYEDEIYTGAIVKLIDRFLSTNIEVLEIINSPDSGSLVPEPLRNDPLGMALFFKYIKKININGEKLRQVKYRAELQRGITNIEKQTGTNVLSMNTFGRLNKSLDDCGICLKPLAAVLMGKPIEVCNNHHMFHDKCIAKWIRNSRNNLCPTCRQPISGAIVNAAVNANNGAVNNNNGVVPGAVNNGVVPGLVNNGVAPGMVNNANNGVVRGGRKRRTLRYKKRKSTRKNMSRK